MSDSAKQDLIEAIKEFNPLADEESLSKKSTTDLQEYLDHLMQIEGVLFNESEIQRL